MTATITAPARRSIGWVATLRAELARTRWSAAAFLPASGLFLALMSTGFAGLARLNGTIEALLSWQALYATGLAAPLMALLAGLAVHREQMARSGGTLWRNVSRARVAVCRVLVLALLDLVFHLLCFAGIAAVATVYGVSGPLTPLISAGAISWASSLGLLALAALAAERVGLIAVFISSVIWQVTGTVTAEKSWWWAMPPSWAVRANLPPLGIHANAVPLEASSPLATESSWPALLAGLAAAVVATWLMSREATTRTQRASRLRSDRPARERSLRQGRYQALSLGFQGTVIGRLTITALLALGLVAAVYDDSYVTGFYTFALLPLGSSLLAVLAWAAQRESWWTLAVREPNIWMALATWLMLRIVGMSAAAAIMAVWAGGGADIGRQLPLWILTGAVMVLLSLALVIRWGPGLALGASAVWTVVSATLGGDVLAHTGLWLFGLPAWAETATNPSRVAVAVVISASLITGLVAAVRAGSQRHCALP